MGKWDTYSILGEKLTAEDIKQLFGVDDKRMRGRVEAGWHPVDAALTPSSKKDPPIFERYFRTWKRVCAEEGLPLTEEDWIEDAGKAEDALELLQLWFRRQGDFVHFVPRDATQSHLTNTLYEFGTRGLHTTSAALRNASQDEALTFLLWWGTQTWTGGSGVKGCDPHFEVDRRHDELLRGALDYVRKQRKLTGYESLLAAYHGKSTRVLPVYMTDTDVKDTLVGALGFRSFAVAKEHRNDSPAVQAVVASLEELLPQSKIPADFLPMGYPFIQRLASIRKAIRRQYRLIDFKDATDANRRAAARAAVSVFKR